MTKQERKYLRSAFHHFDKKLVRHTDTPDYTELAAEWRRYKNLLKIIYHVLSIQGDIDDEVEGRLKELFTENKIELLD